jgi:hypothetical protein
LPQYLPFKTTEGAFEYACNLHSDEVREASCHVAIVLDSKELFGTKNAIKVQDDGVQIATLKIANSDGGFNVVAQTAVKNAPLLKPGDLVLWVAGKHLAEMGARMGDDRSGWAGLIVAVLSPELKTNTGAFRVSLDYRDLPQLR